MLRPDGLDGLGVLGLPVFDVLGFVKHHGVKLQAPVALRVPPDQGIARHDQFAVRQLLELRMPLRSMQGQHLQRGGELAGFRHPIEHQAGRTDNQPRGAPRILPDHMAQERQGLERFAQTHFVGQNPAETVLAQKLQPRDPLLLIGAQHRFQIVQGRALQPGVAALLGRTVAPRVRRLHFPVAMLAQRRFHKACLLMADPIARRMLLRRAIQQHLLQFLHRTRVDHRHFSVGQAGVVLPRQYQSLNLRRRELVPAGRREHHAQVKPLHPRRRDLKRRFHALQVFQRPVLQLLIQRDAPFALQTRILARQKVQHAVLARQLQSALRVQARETAALQPAERRLLRREIAGRITRRHLRIRQPDGLVRRRDAQRHDPRPIGALQPGGQLRKPALEFQQETRGLRFKRKIRRLKIGLHAARRLELRPVLAQKQRHLRPRDAHRRLENVPHQGRQSQRLELLAMPHPIANLRERPRLARQCQHDFPVRLEGGAERQGQRRAGDLHRAGLAQREVFMARQQRQQGREVPRIQLQERGRFAPGQRLQMFDDHVVRRREGKRAPFGQRIQRAAPAIPARFQHEHHLAARQRRLQIRREDDVQLRRGAGGIALQGCGPPGRHDRPGLAGEAARGCGRGHRFLLPELVQAHRHHVRADLAPFPGVTTCAEIFHVNLPLDHQRGAKGKLPGAHHPAQQRRRPMRADHLPLLKGGARLLHDLPTGRVAEEFLAEFNGHSGEYARWRSCHSSFKAPAAANADSHEPAANFTPDQVPFTPEFLLCAP